MTDGRIRKMTSTPVDLGISMDSELNFHEFIGSENEAQQIKHYLQNDELINEEDSIQKNYCSVSRHLELENLVKDLKDQINNLRSEKNDLIKQISLQNKYGITILNIYLS